MVIVSLLVWKVASELVGIAGSVDILATANQVDITLLQNKRFPLVYRGEASLGESTVTLKPLIIFITICVYLILIMRFRRGRRIRTGIRMALQILLQRIRHS